MAEFICRNGDCRNKDIRYISPTTTFRFVGGRLLADERFCLLCNQEMEEIEKSTGTEGFSLKEQFGSINKNWTKTSGKTIY